MISEFDLDVFFGLELGQIRILKFLALKGPLSITELGKLTSRGTINGFDRWGVKKRILGSTQFYGLIPYDYVQKIKKNKKETLYNLTLKGFMASLSNVDFDDQFYVKRYKEYLSKYAYKSEKVNSILTYIEDEIDFILQVNNLQGINWFQFKFLKRYLQKNRVTEKGQFYIDSGIEIGDLEDSVKSHFEYLYNKYYNSYTWAVYDCFYYDADKVYRAWKKHLKNKTPFNPKIKESVVLNNLNQYWFLYFDLPHLPRTINEHVSFYLDTNDFDMREAILKMSKKEIAELAQS